MKKQLTVADFGNVFDAIIPLCSDIEDLNSMTFAALVITSNGDLNKAADTIKQARELARKLDPEFKEATDAMEAHRTKQKAADEILNEILGTPARKETVH
jgi:hypothetical protein